MNFIETLRQDLSYPCRTLLRCPGFFTIAVARNSSPAPWGPNPTWSTIIGVAGDVKQFGLDSEPSLDMYFPSHFPASLVLHTAGNPQSLMGPVRRAIREIDPDLPVSEVRTMDQMLAESASARRTTTVLLAASCHVRSRNGTPS